MKNRLLVQLKRFFLVGLAAVFLDWGFYLIFIYFFDFKPIISKAISYLIGAVFAFIVNGLLVFESYLVPTKLLRHLLIYTISLIANTWIFKKIESYLNFEFRSRLIVALAGATLVSMIINFAGMRYWVFKVKAVNHACG